MRLLTLILVHVCIEASPPLLFISCCWIAAVHTRAPNIALTLKRVLSLSDHVSLEYKLHDEALQKHLSSSAGAGSAAVAAAAAVVGGDDDFDAHA